VQIDDAYIGGEKRVSEGGRKGRGSQNKIGKAPFRDPPRLGGAAHVDDLCHALIDITGDGDMGR
jgi:hypothetical protein